MSGPESHPYKFAEIDPSDTERVFRRCRRSHIDPQTGEVGYWLFKNGQDGMMSVDAERCRSEKDECESVQATGWGVVALPAHWSVEQGQVLIYWPEDSNDAHAQVVGGKPQSVQKKLADRATLLLPAEID